MIVVPDAAHVSGGPYRRLVHPGHIAVVTEGLALPPFHSARATAVVLTVPNGSLPTTRIRTESAALTRTA